MKRCFTQNQRNLGQLLGYVPNMGEVHTDQRGVKAGVKSSLGFVCRRSSVTLRSHPRKTSGVRRRTAVIVGSPPNSDELKNMGSGSESRSASWDKAATSCIEQYCIDFLAATVMNAGRRLL